VKPFLSRLDPPAQLRRGRVQDAVVVVGIHSGLQGDDPRLDV
jgi:hypothetical protein